MCGGFSATRCPAGPVLQQTGASAVRPKSRWWPTPGSPTPLPHWPASSTTRRARSEICVRRSASTAPTPNRSSTAWPEPGRPSWAASPRCGFPASSVSYARLQAADGPEAVSEPKSTGDLPRPAGRAPGIEARVGATDLGDPAGPAERPGFAGRAEPARLGIAAAGDAQGRVSEASYLAAEAVAAAATPPGAPVTAGIGAANALFRGQPELDGNSLDEAFKRLLESGEPGSAPVHAVVTTEQQLFRRAATLTEVTSAVRHGSRPVRGRRRLPAVLLAGDWISHEQASAASEFERFLCKPEQLAELAKAGFRTEGGDPPSSEVNLNSHPCRPR